jgi:hypothetical protein
MEGLFTLGHTSFVSIVAEFLILLGLGAAIIWFAARFVSSPDLSASNENSAAFKPPDVKTRVAFKQKFKIAFLDGLIIFIGVFTAYMTVFSIIVGSGAFNWGKFPTDTANTYFQILPQILILTLTIIAYISLSSSLKREINP